MRTDLLAAGATDAEVTQAIAQAHAAPPGLRAGVRGVARPLRRRSRHQHTSENVYEVPGTAVPHLDADGRDHQPARRPRRGHGRPDLRRGAEEAGRALRRRERRRPDRAGAEPGAHARRHADDRDQRRRLRAATRSRGWRPTAATPDAPCTPRSIPGCSVPPRRRSRPRRGQNVSMVAIQASTGRVLAVVSDPVTTYDTALQGAYPPGSTFKVIDSTALFRKGLGPGSPASCPPDDHRRRRAVPQRGRRSADADDHAGVHRVLQHRLHRPGHPAPLASPTSRPRPRAVRAAGQPAPRACPRSTPTC